MAFDTLRLILIALKYIPCYALSSLLDHIKAIQHQRTYEALDSSKNIVVVGGSFAGVQVAQKLASSVPTGYKVVLIEKNSHLNYTFNFPRYSVLQGHEKLAFIPYDNIAKDLPKGSFQLVQGVVKEVRERRAVLGDGTEIDYAFLVMATGCSQSPPANLCATERDEACGELRGYQKAIQAADRIAVVGGGAVGVELVADVKSFYPDKEVTLVHSRDQLLPRFGKKLHEHVLSSLKRLGVEVLLNQRPRVLPSKAESGTEGAKSLRLKNGDVLDFDLVIPCTGQTPNSRILSTYLPDSISKSTGRIIVQPSLQVKDSPNSFALGDVAETGAPKMARAAFFQASVVQRNILALCQQRNATAVYRPRLEIEGALKLTLGESEVVIHCQPEKGEEIVLTSNKGAEDLDVERAWRQYGADIRRAKG